MKLVSTAILGSMAFGLSAMAAQISVVDHGAAPGDAGDDSTAIASAIAASSAGDTVHFPAGVYRISTSIAPKSGTVLSGVSRENSIVRFAGTTDKAMVSLDGRSNVEITGLSFDGNGNAHATQGIAASGGNGHSIHGIEIRNLVVGAGFGPHGIYFSSAVTDSAISGNVFTNMAPTSEWGVGMRLSNGSSRNVIECNTIDRTGRGGILCDTDSTDLVIRGNTVTNSGLHSTSASSPALGIEIWSGCDRATIEDNEIDHWLSVNRSSGCAVRRNVVRDASGAFKFQGDASGISRHYFHANEFLQTPKNHPDAWYPNQGHGFRFNKGCLDIVLEGNVISSNGGAGIQTSSEIDRLSFVGNTISDNGDRSITSDPADTDLEWSGNTVTGNSVDTQLVSRGFANGKPSASFLCDAAVHVGVSASFTNGSTDPDGTIANVLWDFGDGVPSTAMNPTHTFPRKGQYTVTLLAWDDGGRGARFEKVVNIIPVPLAVALTSDKSSAIAGKYSLD